MESEKVNLQLVLKIYIYFFKVAAADLTSRLNGLMASTLARPPTHAPTKQRIAEKAANRGETDLYLLRRLRAQDS